VLLMHEATGILEHVLLVIAITFGTINVVGGFLVTDRMLGMFKKKPDPVESAGADSIGSSAGAALPAGVAKAGSGGSELPATSTSASTPASTPADSTGGEAASRGDGAA